MSESIEKLRPDRDLQCYFLRPSAIAAMSGGRSTGFTVSGTWRQAFDWAVIEWNRNNVFEHPLLRYLPDGDLSGLTLSYQESRNNCILMDSTLFPTVDWPYLRIWAEDAGGQEQLYRVRLKDHATAVTGSYAAAQATFSLGGTLTVGDVVELSWVSEHYFHTVNSGDTIQSVVNDLAVNIDAFSSTVTPDVSAGNGTVTLANKIAGHEGNRLGIVGSVSGAQTEQWSPSAQTMSGGASPTQWQVDLDFGSLTDTVGVVIPTNRIRKMRWTYSAALQIGPFTRSDFDITVSGWSVTGVNRAYYVASPRSRRFENDSSVQYSGAWAESAGNFSGGTIHETNQVGASARVDYFSQINHRLLLGTRKTFEAGIISVSVDGGAASDFDLFLPAEDVLVRLDLGMQTPGPHIVEATLIGQNPLSTGNSFYFDFVEEAIESTSIESQPVRPGETLATDWDTDHSLALPPERVAWNLNMLGFKGRANHYAGAILFYELTNPGNIYSQGTVTFQGTPVFSQMVSVVVDGTAYNRLTLSTDSNESIAKAFEYLINDGTTGVWASASGNVLTIQARTLGVAGNALSLSASPASGSFLALTSGATLAGGADGQWLTDTAALPRLNRAARDWHRAYFAALAGHGISGTASFSMELSHGDPSLAAGIAQRYPDGSPVVLNTPALQTNFSPTSLAYWQQVYLEMAELQDEASVTPFLQFGEVQWWYFPNASGMTFYDDYTKAEFLNRFGRPMHVFTANTESPTAFPEESAFLPELIGNFTAAIRAFVKATYPTVQFEVLYPPDVNDFPLTQVVNFASADWTPAKVDLLKTENFSYTGARNLNKSRESILFPQAKGFPRSRSAHLIGVFNASEPWDWERRLARGQAIESVVLWAFDQFSMIGYGLPLSNGIRSARFLGS